MSKMTGGCLCGDVRYEYQGEVGSAGICHCSDCRRISGSAFGVSVKLAKAGFAILSGALSGYTKRADSGRELTRYFCSRCGSPIYTASAAHPDFVYVKAGSLDDPALVRPAYQAWTQSAVAWAHIPPDLPAFEKGRT